MSAMSDEEEDNFRLRKADQHLDHCKEVEGEARRALTRAIDDRLRAKEKREALFLENEARAVARRKSGQIVNSSCYGD